MALLVSTFKGPITYEGLAILELLLSLSLFHLQLQLQKKKKKKKKIN
jgi:hypothetical protein